MTRSCARALLLLLIAGTPLAAQLPMITVPHGVLQFGISGAFFPNDREWVDGQRVPLGELVDPAVLGTDLQTRLSQTLGIPVTGLTLGATTIAAREHGIGDIGLGYGLTHRISLFVTIPVVYVRSRFDSLAGASGGRVGLNPANRAAGNAFGQQQTSAFFTQFDAALAQLSQNLQAGVYSGDAALQASAQQTLTSGTAMRASLYSLLGDPTHSSLLLPLQNDVYGATLLAEITGLQSSLNSQFSVSGFTGIPALPTTPLSGTDATSLVTSSDGLGFRSPNLLPKTGIGDIEAGVAMQLIATDSVAASHWHDVWLRATARFPTGTAPDASILLDQGTGSKSPALRLEAIAEAGRRRIGLRGDISYQHALAANVLARISPLDALLVPATNVAALRVQPGDSLAVTLRPFFQFAPHLAAAAMVQYWRTATSRTSYLAGQAPIIGVDPSEMDLGSAADAIIVGIGINYSHPGGDGDTGGGLPIEAGWSFERTVHSAMGIFPEALTTRVTLRIYRPILKH